MTISHNPCIGHSLEAIHIHGIHFYYKCIILMLCLLAAVLYSLKPERAEGLSLFIIYYLLCTYMYLIFSEREQILNQSRGRRALQ